MCGQEPTVGAQTGTLIVSIANQYAADAAHHRPDSTTSLKAVLMHTQSHMLAGGLVLR